MKRWNAEQRTDLVVSEEPEARCLIMLVIADETVVRPNLKQVLPGGRIDLGSVL